MHLVKRLNVSGKLRNRTRDDHPRPSVPLTVFEKSNHTLRLGKDVLQMTTVVEFFRSCEVF